ncbi:MAG: hypothetical protein AAB467_00300 [Patescibacteria group bacterium]
MKTYRFIASTLVTLVLVVPSGSFAKGNAIQLATAFNPMAYLGSVAAENSVALDRAERIDNYFQKRGMPLAGNGEIFVRVAEKCNIDWRLLPAIGVRESSGGLHMQYNNPFGWGSAKIKFYNFEDAIETVSDNLCGFNPGTARYYKDQTTMKRLWYYNGTVMPSYPEEVVDIMDAI